MTSGITQIENSIMSHGERDLKQKSILIATDHWEYLKQSKLLKKKISFLGEKILQSGQYDSFSCWKYQREILLESIKDNFAKIDEGIKRKRTKNFSTKDYSSFSLYHQKEDRPQITFSISFPLFGWKEIERTKNLETAFLNDIFGLGFSSRLFQKSKRKRKTRI